MVAYYGLDNEIGPISYYDSTGQNDRLIGKPYSEDMARKIDKEVQALVTVAYEKTKNILLDHKDQLENLAQLLLQKEVVDLEDLESILGKRGLALLDKSSEK